jgi:hypothetical protein
MSCGRDASSVRASRATWVFLQVRAILVASRVQRQVIASSPRCRYRSRQPRLDRVLPRKAFAIALSQSSSSYRQASPLRSRPSKTRIVHERTGRYRTPATSQRVMPRKQGLGAYSGPPGNVSACLPHRSLSIPRSAVNSLRWTILEARISMAGGHARSASLKRSKKVLQRSGTHKATRDPVAPAERSQAALNKCERLAVPR